MTNGSNMTYGMVLTCIAFLVFASSIVLIWSNRPVAGQFLNLAGWILLEIYEVRQRRKHLQQVAHDLAMAS